MMLLYTLIALYIFISAFYAGWLLANENPWYNILFASFFGMPIVFYAALLGISGFIWEQLCDIFQIKLYWQYMLGNIKTNILPHDLKKLNDYCRKHRNTGSIKDRIYRHGLSLVNKKNNYTYKR